MKGKKGGSLGTAMKAVGRNMARANNQKASAKVPMKFASGGGVMPKAKDMGMMGGKGMMQTGFGSGTARGGKSTKGKKFGGVY